MLECGTGQPQRESVALVVGDWGATCSGGVQSSVGDRGHREPHPLSATSTAIVTCTTTTTQLRNLHYNTYIGVKVGKTHSKEYHVNLI